LRRREGRADGPAFRADQDRYAEEKGKIMEIKLVVSGGKRIKRVGRIWDMVGADCEASKNPPGIGCSGE
jgi:hypothetical protein